MIQTLNYEEAMVNLRTLFYKHKPQGNSSPVEQARKDLVSKKFIRQVGPEQLNCHVITNTAKAIEACKGNPAKMLQVIGACVVPVIPNNQIPIYQQEFDAACNTFPEYKRDAGEPLYIFGNNGALGNPASFHNKFSRKIRSEAAVKAREVLMQIAQDQPDEKIKWTNMQALFDRMLIRPADKAPSGESWHRDEMNSSQIDKFDLILGGWVNLDVVSQRFSFVPGSHLGMHVSELEGGFAEVEAFCKANGYSKQQTTDLMTELGACAFLMEVPPGHMIMFPQHIMHEIVSRKVSHKMRRQYTGWRLTRLASSIYMQKDEKDKKRKAGATEDSRGYYDLSAPEGVDRLNAIMENQEIAQLPGSMMPPMYAKMHMVHFKQQIAEWSKVFVPGALDNNGIVARFIPSLKALGLPLYPAYSAEEKKIYQGIPITN